MDTASCRLAAGHTLRVERGRQETLRFNESRSRCGEEPPRRWVVHAVLANRLPLIEGEVDQALVP